MKKFINLHTNTEYSILESTIRIDALINFAKANNLEALAITDHNVLYGVAEFIAKCQQNKIQPIVGLDLDVEDYRLILIAKNYQGYLELIRLSSLKGHETTILLQMIKTVNLAIIDHPTHGAFALYQRTLMFDNYWIGLEHGEHQKGIRVQEVRILKTTQENEALKVLNHISHDQETEVFNYQPYPLRTIEATTMDQRTVELIANCHWTLPHITNNVPAFQNKDHLSSQAYLTSLVITALKSDSKIADNPLYQTRVNAELKIINQLKYNDYFLIIWDLIAWSKKHQIAIGPGRGSAAGSLVAFLLKITEVDPLQYGLIFERFLNPGRATMPDIDIDIQDSRRDEVVAYMFQKYGADFTALIITFQRLGAKMAIRDAGRFLNVRAPQVDLMSKLIPNLSSLATTYQTSAAFRALLKRDATAQKIFDVAQTIEGLPRQVGTHAAGIVISKQPLKQLVPTLLNSEGKQQTQYSMEYLERNGLLKIDLLGLKNLTIIQNIEAGIYEHHHKKLNLNQINFADQKTNALLSRGDTNGIFQLESYGMKATVATVGVNSLNDIVAIISLYRPGPIDQIKLYASRKKSQLVPVEINAEYSAILAETYGIIVYQEQVIQIATKFSGMSLSQADIFRRAISKKDQQKMAALKSDFINGAIKNRYEEEVATQVYQEIAKFANYGFNKSHAVAYSIIAYRMAFLKAWFPLEFYVALLNASQGSQKSLIKYLEEAKMRAIQIVAPDVNLSQDNIFRFAKQIVLPLTIIKGFGAVANQKVLAERTRNGPFLDFYNFVARVKMSGLGTTLIASLIAANALKQFGNMATLTNALPAALRFSEMISEKDSSGHKKLDFELIPTPQLVFAEREIDAEIAAEEKVYGFRLNVFPTDKYPHPHALLDLTKQAQIFTPVYLEKIYRKRNKNDQEFARAIVSDASISLEIMIFANDWKAIKAITKLKQVYYAQIGRNSYQGLAHYRLLKPWKVA